MLKIEPTSLMLSRISFRILLGSTRTSLKACPRLSGSVLKLSERFRVFFAWIDALIFCVAGCSICSCFHKLALIPLAEFSDPTIMKKYGVTPDAETLEIVTLAARQKEAEVLLKVYWGDAREKLCEAVDNVPLDQIVVGNRGLGVIKRAIMGSVNNYVVNNATCPVTVVKKVDQN